MRGLDEVEPLEVDLVLPGHGRTFRDPAAKIAEARRQVDELLAKVRESLAEGEKAAFEIVAEIVGPEGLKWPVSGWVLQIVLSCLDHLAILGEVAPVEGTDPQRWTLALRGRVPLPAQLFRWGVGGWPRMDCRKSTSRGERHPTPPR